MKERWLFDVSEAEATERLNAKGIVNYLVKEKITDRSLAGSPLHSKKIVNRNPILRNQAKSLPENLQNISFEELKDRAVDLGSFHPLQGYSKISSNEGEVVSGGGGIGKKLLADEGMSGEMESNLLNNSALQMVLGGGKRFLKRKMIQIWNSTVRLPS